VRLVALVDFENDCLRTSVEVAHALGDRLDSVRLDTSEMLVDRSLWDHMGSFPPTGVNATLVRNVRRGLDDAGYPRVKIMVSGGFTEEKIRAFEQDAVPADAYGVGSSLFGGRFDFTADIVLVQGKPGAKAGRSYRENPRLQLVE
jgi:nicotinate phosphoribosyltransferase